MSGVFCGIHGHYARLVRRWEMQDDELVAEWGRQRREEYEWRDHIACLYCDHIGAEHDYDEVGECQACGCAAFGYSL